MGNANRTSTNTLLKITSVLNAKNEPVLPEGELSIEEFATFSGTCPSEDEQWYLLLKGRDTEGAYEFPVEANTSEWSIEVRLNQTGRVKHHLLNEKNGEESDDYPINWI